MTTRNRIAFHFTIGRTPEPCGLRSAAPTHEPDGPSGFRGIHQCLRGRLWENAIWNFDGDADPSMIPSDLGKDSDYLYRSSNRVASRNRFWRRQRPYGQSGCKAARDGTC